MKKILLVDDETDFVEVMRQRLEANNYIVVPAYDGEEALKKVKEEKPDLILLDIMIPLVDGFDVCRRLKIDEKYKDIPIIMLTAKFQPVDVRFGAAMGADAYLTKPLDSKVVLAKIEELLKNKK
jgi:two-component system, OmpR family, alkaline phosphatase synthesis response regulator PhoP